MASSHQLVPGHAPQALLAGCFELHCGHQCMQGGNSMGESLRIRWCHTEGIDASYHNDIQRCDEFLPGWMAVGPKFVGTHDFCCRQMWRCQLQHGHRWVWHVAAGVGTLRVDEESSGESEQHHSQGDPYCISESWQVFWSGKNGSGIGTSFSDPICWPTPFVNQVRNNPLSNFDMQCNIIEINSWKFECGICKIYTSRLLKTHLFLVFPSGGLCLFQAPMGA